MNFQGPWYRVQAIPASTHGLSAEWDFATVLPAVLSAAQSGQPFVAGWLSRGGGGKPLEMITNAGPVAGSGLLFPGGAKGAPLDAEWLGWAGELTWAVCPARLAPPLAGTPDRGPGRFEAALVTLMDRAFGWLVIAGPLGDKALDAELTNLRHELRLLRRGDDTPALERAERRMAELDTFSEGGLWSVRVLVGADSEPGLSQIAPMLVGSADVHHHPYRLGSGHLAGSLTEALAVGNDEPAPADAGQESASAPFVATAGLLGALAGIPRREVPGLRVLDPGHFDVTSETRDGLELGHILDGQDRSVGTFTVPMETINRHVFVTGATGSGKSQTVRHLLERLTVAGVPWLAIEPAKPEYAAMAGRVEPAQVTVINPSDPRAVPLSVNPLAPEPGYPVQAHIDMVRALFQAAFDAEEPFPQIMAQALQRVYENNGWDVVTGAGVPGTNDQPTVPTLEQLHKAALRVIGDVGYGAELAADVKGFVDVRLRSLRIGSAGRFFEGGHPADIAGLLSGNVVLAIEDVANDEDKAFLMGTLIIRVVEHLRLRERRRRKDVPPPVSWLDGQAPGGGTSGLRHVIVIEEAHRLLRNRGEGRASSHAVELFAGMLAEIRAYGEGIVVAEQIPAKLVPDVVKNTALKVVHRLPAHDDRHVVGAAMNLDDDQSRAVVSLEPGVAAVFADGMDRPVRVRVPLGEGRERVLPGPPPPIDGRRSVACGCECRQGRACTLYELREADVLATGPEGAWLRIWAEILVLAHLANRPMPCVPSELGRRWAALASRLRDCLLASVLERSVERRSAALRTAYDPAELTKTVADVAPKLLSGAFGLAGALPGVDWILPQLRWLHEMDRILGGSDPDKHAPAPPLDYTLPGLKQQPGAQIGHRLRALRRHSLSIEIERNRSIADITIAGDDDHEGLAEDLALVAVGSDEAEQLGYVAETMHVASWLEPVIGWPDRFLPPVS